jgi:hypothetical protein
LLGLADDAADKLEETLFLLTLLRPEGIAGDSIAALQDLGGLLVQGSQEYLKAVENARLIHRSSPRDQVGDFLGAVDRTMTMEYHTDDAHRRARAGVLNFSGDFKQLHLFSAIADSLEEAADVLLRSVLTLRDYVLGEVITH